MGPQGFSPGETDHVDRCFTILEHFPIYFVTGKNTDLGPIETDYFGHEVFRFDDAYFEDNKGLARLFMNPDFYDRFSWSEFMFLFKPNTLIVKNELRHWCRQGYDYIQADPHGPSLRRVDSFLKHTRKSRKAFEFVQSNPDADFEFWKKKTTGFLPSLRTPPVAVLNYFITPGAFQTDLAIGKQPFLYLNC